MLWDIAMPRFPKMEGDQSCEVLVIGGGMAGVLCARFLTDCGLNTILVEGKRIGGGVTRKTTAVLTAQHDTLYTELIADFGEQQARSYLKANLWAVEQFRRLAEQNQCDLETRPSYIYSKTNGELMRQEAATVARLGFPAEFTRSTELPIKILGAVRFPEMAQFHPMKLLAAVARGLRIYEDTFVQKLHGTTAITEHGEIHAKYVVVATHYPFINRVGLFPAKLYQMRSYVLVLENAGNLEGTYVDHQLGGLYFRDYNGMLILGGSDSRTGSATPGHHPLREFAKEHYPQAIERYAFANQDCISLDGVPYIGRYSSMMPNVYVASGFNEWGMTSSMVAARILSDRIMGKQNQWESLFSPGRSIFKKQLFYNLRATVTDFVQPTAKRCSHMGCALEYNRAEHSWDCPCHGSRFGEDGRLLDSPAMRPLHTRPGEAHK